MLVYFIQKLNFANDAESSQEEMKVQDNETNRNILEGIEEKIKISRDMLLLVPTQKGV